MYEQLRRTHPRLGNAAHGAFEETWPLVETLACPTCGTCFDQPLHVEQEREDLDFTRFSRPVIHPPRRVWVTCPHGHQWSVEAIMYRTPEDGAAPTRVHRLRLGHHIGTEAPCVRW